MSRLLCRRRQVVCIERRQWWGCGRLKVELPFAFQSERRRMERSVAPTFICKIYERYNALATELVPPSAAAVEKKVHRLTKGIAGKEDEATARKIKTARRQKRPDARSLTDTPQEMHEILYREHKAEYLLVFSNTPDNMEAFRPLRRFVRLNGTFRRVRWSSPRDAENDTHIWLSLSWTTERIYTHTVTILMLIKKISQVELWIVETLMIPSFKMRFFD